MSKKRTLEEEINSFLEIWDINSQVSFLNHVYEFIKLYDIEEDDDWVKKIVGGDEENVRTIRLIRTVYLMSKIAYFHAGKFCTLKCEFKDLWHRMEKEGIEKDLDS